MRIKLSATTIMISLLFAASAQASCLVDQSQMLSQIHQYGSITTVERYQVNDVKEVFGAGTCIGTAYRFGKYLCQLGWDEGNWGDTLHCQR